MTGAVSNANRLRAFWMLVIANFFWGLSFPVIKSVLLLHDRLVPEAGRWFATVYTVAPRFLIATCLMIAWRPRGFWRITALEWKQGGVIGFFAGGGILLQNDALQYTEASTSAFLTQFYAILIPIWLALRHRRDPGPVVWTCCLLVLIGVAILGRFNPLEVFSPGAGHQGFGRGEWETLLCSVFFMVQILWLEKKEFAANRPEKITLVMFAVQAVMFWALVPWFTPSFDSVLRPWTSVPWLGLTAVLALFCTVGAYSLMNAWQPKITATEAGLIYCIEPIFGSILACFLPALFSIWASIQYPNETATWSLMIGGGLITIANVILQLKPPAK